MSKPVPPKEPKQSQGRPAASPAAATKAQAAPATGAKPGEPGSRVPQVSRAKVIEPAAFSHEQIAVRAYMIWIDRGQPEGTELENWLEAERQLMPRR